MLQQKQPDDLVIATVEEHSVKQFVEIATEELRMEITWQGD